MLMTCFFVGLNPVFVQTACPESWSLTIHTVAPLLVVFDTQLL